MKVLTTQGKVKNIRLVEYRIYEKEEWKKKNLVEHEIELLSEKREDMSKIFGSSERISWYSDDKIIVTAEKRCFEIGQKVDIVIRKSKEIEQKEKPNKIHFELVR